MWTIDSVKSYLPNTLIVIKGQQVPCQVTGRANEYATITFGGVGAWVRCEVAWSSVVRSLNGQGVLQY